VAILFCASRSRARKRPDPLSFHYRRQPAYKALSSTAPRRILAFMRWALISRWPGSSDRAMLANLMAYSFLAVRDRDDAYMFRRSQTGKAAGVMLDQNPIMRHAWKAVRGAAERNFITPFVRGISNQSVPARQSHRGSWPVKNSLPMTLQI